MSARPASPTVHRSVIALDSAASVIAGMRRASAQRHDGVVLQGEWRALGAMASDADAWADLAARSLEPNVFYDPHFAHAAAPVFGRDAGAVLIWSSAPVRRLLGLFPARLERNRYGLPLPVLVGWTHPYAPLGTPLVDREMPEAVIAAWLDLIAQDPALPDLILLPLVPTEGAFARNLAAVLAAADMPVAHFGEHARALMAPQQGDGGYLTQAVGRRKRKELQRQLRRLGDIGKVSTISVAEPRQIAQALDSFLLLETTGWKGRAHTAAAQHPELRIFMHRVIGALAAAGQARIDLMQLDDRPIAAGITLISGTTAWFWKIAYDESYGPFSPGVQLVRTLTERLAADPAITRVDSCASAHHPMIDHLWRERLTLADLLIGMRPGPFGRAQRIERLRRSAIAAARSVRDLMRRH